MMTIETGKRILIVGASGDLGFALLQALSSVDIKAGAHYCRHEERLSDLLNDKTAAEIKLFGADISSQKDCHALIDAYVTWAGGIDYLVQLSGSVENPALWDRLSQKEWDRDMAVNLSGPFFLCQAAMKHMSKQGGKIILSSTASALHGGGRNSMAYGAAKAGIECVVKGLAREGGKHNILVNAIAPGFIETKFHTEQMKKTKDELLQRAQMVPLKRAGTPEDIVSAILFLLSPGGKYITGQTIAISGGDWL